MTVVEFETWVEWYRGALPGGPVWKNWRKLPEDDKRVIRKLIDYLDED